MCISLSTTIWAPYRAKHVSNHATWGILILKGQRCIHNYDRSPRMCQERSENDEKQYLKIFQTIGRLVSIAIDILRPLTFDENGCRQPVRDEYDRMIFQEHKSSDNLENQSDAHCVHHLRLCEETGYLHTYLETMERNPSSVSSLRPHALPWVKASHSYGIPPPDEWASKTI